MGWFDGASSVSSGHKSNHSHKSHKDKSHHHHSSSSRPTTHRTHSTPSLFNFGAGHENDRDRNRPDSNARSIFGGGHHNSSRASFFGFARTPSHRRPRSGYLKRAYAQLRRLLRDLLYYLKRNPIKVFVLVIMPLLTGGVLTGLLRKFGIRLPGGLDKMFGGHGRATGIGRGRDGGLQWERTKVDGPLGALGGISNLASGVGGINGAVGLAKMFL